MSQESISGITTPRILQEYVLDYKELREQLHRLCQKKDSKEAISITIGAKYNRTVHSIPYCVSGLPRTIQCLQ